MIRAISLFLLTFSTQVAADDWQPMKGEQIRETLNGTRLQYESASQFFMANGQTEYVDGRPSLGRWEVRGDQYCSVWPPSDFWVCYDMFQKPGHLRFVGESGDPTDGVIQ